ncbi:MAG: lipopolysaccharide transport periplasmic protein LptA [Burkholderiales bacterium]|nr:lipopolysaccharide transport periplasmic protein LptA [Burkholderiales bacterium]
MRAAASKMLRPFALIAVAFLPATVVYAEQADRNKPITIEGDLVTLDQAKLVRVLEGNVILVQGTLRLTAERIVVKEDAGGAMTAQAFGTPNKQIAFKQKREGSVEWMEGASDRAEFDEKTDTLKLLSRARLKSGGDELKGEYIYYNFTTEVMQVRNAIPDAKGSVTPANLTNRPTITIQPKVLDDKPKQSAPVKIN